MRDNKLTFWQRISVKRRISIVDDHTLKELWSFRLSKLGVLITFSLLFAFAIGCLSLLILFTPIKRILPGYNEDLRNELMAETSRLDSLANTLELQQQYLGVIRDITAGEISTDSVQSLDTLQIMAHEQLLEAKAEATEDFIEQYEQKEKDYLQLFDIQDVTPTVTLFRPVHGVVTPPPPLAREIESKGVIIKTAEKENVTAVLAGAIVYINYELDNTYTVMMQHTNYISIYHGLGSVTKQIGDNLKAGETIGMIGTECMLNFELWKDGEAINPEDVIAF